MRALGSLTGGLPRLFRPRRGGGEGRGRSVRFRLLAIALLPTLVILPLLLGVTILRWNAKFDATLISKVNGDLTIAHQYLSRIVENTGEQIAALGASARLRDALAASPRGGRDLGPLLAEMRAGLGLDFLHLVEADGTVRAAAAPSTGARLGADWPILASARAGQRAAAIDVFGAGELAAIDPALAARADRAGADRERGPNGAQRRDARHGGPCGRAGRARPRRRAGAGGRCPAEPEPRLHRHDQ